MGNTKDWLFMAYTQVDISQPTNMEFPPGISFWNMSKQTQRLKILKKMYGGKESGMVWFTHLKTTLTTKLKYLQSKYDECVFYKDTNVFFVNTSDGILIDP